MRSFCHLFDRTPSLRDLPINTTSGIFFRDFFALLNPYISGSAAAGRATFTACHTNQTIADISGTRMSQSFFMDMG